GREALLRVSTLGRGAEAKQSFADGVPKQSLGTREFRVLSLDRPATERIEVTAKHSVPRLQIRQFHPGALTGVGKRHWPRSDESGQLLDIERFEQPETK